MDNYQKYLAGGRLGRRREKNKTYYCWDCGKDKPVDDFNPSQNELDPLCPRWNLIKRCKLCQKIFNLNKNYQEWESQSETHKKGLGKDPGPRPPPPPGSTPTPPPGSPAGFKDLDSLDVSNPTDEEKKRIEKMKTFYQQLYDYKFQKKNKSDEYTNVSDTKPNPPIPAQNKICGADGTGYQVPTKDEDRCNKLKRYYIQSLRHHPDRRGDTEDFKTINQIKEDCDYSYVALIN